MWHTLLTLIVSACVLGVAHAQSIKSNSVDDPAYVRMRLLVEIGEPSRSALAVVLTQAQAVMTSDEADRPARVQAFSDSAVKAKLAIGQALQELESLSTFPSTPSKPNHAALINNHQMSAIQGFRSALELVSRLEAAVAAFSDGDVRAFGFEAGALVDASVWLVREAADQSRIRSRLSPEFPWVEPSDNALADLMDGLGSLMALLGSPTEQKDQIRHDIRKHANQLRANLTLAKAAVSNSESDPKLSPVLVQLQPGLGQRFFWLNEAAEQLEAAALAKDASEQRTRLMNVRSLYRQITESQRSSFR